MVTMMDGCNILLKVPRALVRKALAITALAAALALYATALTPAFAEEAAAPAAPEPAGDEQCLGCHGYDGMEKKLGDGVTLNLHIPGDTFAKSVHSVVGCTGCHSDVDLKSHPPADKEIASKRGFSIGMIQICRGCHEDKFDQWQTSIHAALVRSSNPAAPICTDCHNPHGVIKGAAASVDQIPCQKCHKEIYGAYVGSMHAKARLKSAESYAPICVDCHSAHAIKPTALGQGPEAACFGCHADLQEKHAEWLPNTALHFEVVSCPACHSPKAQRRVDLLLMNAADDQPLGNDQVGVPLFEASSQSGGKGIDAQGLATLLETLSRTGVAGKTMLRGRLEAATPAQAHQLASKGEAISECKTCHSSGSQPFQSVTISVLAPQGQRVPYGANADVLSSAISVASVGGFYAIGGTRIKLLDILFFLAVLGGGGFAVGHVLMGWGFKLLGLYNPPHAEHGGGHGGGGHGDGGHGSAAA